MDSIMKRSLTKKRMYKAKWKGCITSRMGKKNSAPWKC